MDSCYITPKEDMHKGAYIIADPHKGLRDGALPAVDAGKTFYLRFYFGQSGMELDAVTLDLLS